MLPAGIPEQWAQTVTEAATNQQRYYDGSLQRLGAIRADWEDFVTTGNVSRTSLVRPEILASWERSRQHGVSPFDGVRVRASPAEFGARLSANRDLINIAGPFLEVFLASVAGSGCRADILDTDLCILRQFGDDDILDLSAESGLGTGAVRSEPVVGTNSMNLAVALQKPVQVAGPEHYSASLHAWTGSSAPVFAHDGSIIGVINMTGHYSRVHAHTLGMTAVLAKAIELSLRQYWLQKEKDIASRYVAGIVDSISDGLIAVNEGGRIAVINETALKLLELDRDVVDERADSVFGPGSTILSTVLNGVSIRESEITFHRRGSERKKMVFGNCLPIRTEDQISGGLAVFKDAVNTRHLVKNAAGFKAFLRFEDLHGQSSGFRSVIAFAQKAASFPSNILLLGESGTGKEIFAQAIHNAGGDRGGPFVGINCAAIPIDLIESELFGYEEGSFTGARRAGQLGKLQLAEGGTLFLDEVDSMPAAMQVKLLRVLQNRSFTRIGGLSEIRVRARLIAATNRDLAEQVRLGNFRGDLYYRLNVVTIEIPPLRFRKEDIRELAEVTCAKLCERLGIDIGLSEPAVAILEAYDWPGNVRELENALERSAVGATSRGSKLIEPDDLMRHGGMKRAWAGHAATPACSLRAAEIDNLAATTRIAIENALRRTEGNISKASRHLGITRKTLYRKIQKYNIPH